MKKSARAKGPKTRRAGALPQAPAPAIFVNTNAVANSIRARQTQFLRNLELSEIRAALVASLFFGEALS